MTMSAGAKYRNENTPGKKNQKWSFTVYRGVQMTSKIS